MRLDGSSGIQPPAKAGHPQQVARDRVWLGFEHLQGWRVRSLPGQPFDHAFSKKKKKHKILTELFISVCARCLFLYHWTLLRRSYRFSRQFVLKAVGEAHARSRAKPTLCLFPYCRHVLKPVLPEPGCYWQHSALKAKKAT